MPPNSGGSIEGPVWNYLCLEAEIAKAGDYRVVPVGSMPVVVARDFDEEVYAFENRCAHRGALIVLDKGGHARDFTCVYHAWNYDLKGNLKAVAFEEGVAGKGGMDKGFCRSDHGPRKLRIALFAGLVFGSLSDDVPPIEEYLGAEVAARIRRVLHKPVVVTGRFSQILPHNWKLYFENVKDTYHASLLHAFFTTFRINRLTQRGGLAVSPNGGNHVSFSYMDERAAGEEYSALGLRADKEDFALRDSSLLTTSTSSTTMEAPRSSLCSRVSCCSRSRTRWRSGIWSRRESVNARSTGLISDLPMTRPSFARFATSTTTWRVPPATFRWRMVASGASCGAASPPPPAQGPSWKWAARARPAKARGRRKPPCAVSGSATATIWGSKALCGHDRRRHPRPHPCVSSGLYPMHRQ